MTTTTVIVHDSTNGHRTKDNITIVDDVITTEDPFTVEHVEHEPLEVPYQNCKKRIVVEKDPYEDKLNYIRD